MIRLGDVTFRDTTSQSLAIVGALPRLGGGHGQFEDGSPEMKIPRRLEMRDRRLDKAVDHG